jgi:hypothetical protein
MFAKLSRDEKAVALGFRQPTQEFAKSPLAQPIRRCSIKERDAKANRVLQ